MYNETVDCPVLNKKSVPHSISSKFRDNLEEKLKDYNFQRK